jgi:hypothetical protein
MICAWPRLRQTWRTEAEAKKSSKSQVINGNIQKRFIIQQVQVEWCVWGIFKGSFIPILHKPLSLSSYHSVIIDSSAAFKNNLLRVVDVVDEVLNDGCGVGGLDALAVVGDHRASRGADDDDALLTLYGKRKCISTRPRIWRMYPEAEAEAECLTFLPYTLRSSALITTNLSPPTEIPLANALSLEV